MLNRCQKVCLLEYRHKHGSDFSVFSSLERARLSAAKLAEHYRDEFEVPNEISNEEAVDQWEELTGYSEAINFLENVKIDEDCDRKISLLQRLYNLME